MVDLSISIITADRQLIQGCLQSIYATVKTVQFEIAVVINDPAASAEIEEAIREKFPAVKLIINREEKGFTHNHNVVIKECTGRYILVLNDDTLLLDGALDKMVAYMERHRSIGILGCKILNEDGSQQWSCGKSFSHSFEYFRSGVLRTLLSPLVRDQFFKETQEVTWVTGACLMARAEAVRAIGPFDEQFTMYFDDGDWCFRMIKGGWKVVYYSDAEIIHYRSRTSRKHLAKTTLFYYQSRMRFFRKHYSSAVLHVVRLLTVFDAIFRALRMLVFSSPPSQKKQLLDAFFSVIKQTVASKSG